MGSNWSELKWKKVCTCKGFSSFQFHLAMEVITRKHSRRQERCLECCYVMRLEAFGRIRIAVSQVLHRVMFLPLWYVWPRRCVKQSYSLMSGSLVVGRWELLSPKCCGGHRSSLSQVVMGFRNWFHRDSCMCIVKTNVVPWRCVRCSSPSSGSIFDLQLDHPSASKCRLKCMHMPSAALLTERKVTLPSFSLA